MVCLIRHDANHRENRLLRIYRKWCVEVKPSINCNWDKMKEVGIIDADFYLADLLSAITQL